MEEMGRTLGAATGATVLNQDIYEISATQKHRLGTRVMRGDCVYRYAKSIVTITDLSTLVWNYYHQDISYAAIATASPIGSNKIYVTSGAADGIANNGTFAAHSLEGGSLVIFDGGTTECYNFGIIDNDAAVSGGTITITLDGELPVATTAASDYVEAMGSPYIVSSGNSGGFRGFQGAPMRLATTTYPYFWIKTWGPHWCSPQTNVGSAHDRNQVCVRHDGSIDLPGGATLMKNGDPLYTENAQLVGYVVTHAQDNTQGAPFIMLQIMP